MDGVSMERKSKTELHTGETEGLDIFDYKRSQVQWWARLYAIHRDYTGRGLLNTGVHSLPVLAVAKCFPTKELAEKQARVWGAPLRNHDYKGVQREAYVEVTELVETDPKKWRKYT